jgi:hypothetical protein
MTASAPLTQRAARVVSLAVSQLGCACGCGPLKAPPPASDGRRCVRKVAMSRSSRYSCQRNSGRGRGLRAGSRSCVGRKGKTERK